MAVIGCLLPGCGRGHGTGRRPAERSATPAAAFCASRPRAGPGAALSRAIPGSGNEELVPLGIGANGRTGYVSAWTPGFSGVAAVDTVTGGLRPILRFADPATDQADGAWGGRWLVWAQTSSLQSLDAFTIYGWDSASGRLVRLGHSLASPGGLPWPSPWHAPAVRGGYAAWAQGYGPAGLVQIRLADLRTGQVTVVAEGHLQAPFFDGPLLVWPESSRPGALTTLRAYSLTSRRTAMLPPVLRPVAGTDFVAADGTRTAYLSPSLTKLYYSASPDRRARVVLRLPPGTQFTGLEIGHDTLAWTTTAATFVADTVTGSYARVTPAYGFAVTGPGPAVLVAGPPASGAGRPRLALHVVTARAHYSPGTARTVLPCGRHS